MGGIRIYNKKMSPVAKDATKIASLIASFKFERGTEIMESEVKILSEAQKVLNNIINRNK
jgi:hypothetical protein